MHVDIQRTVASTVRFRHTGDRRDARQEAGRIPRRTAVMKALALCMVPFNPHP